LGFARSFLETGKTLPLGNRTIMAVQGLLVGGAFLGFVDHVWSSRFISIITLVVASTILTNASILVARGNRPARIFVAAWLALILGSVMAPLRNAGLLPITNVALAIQLGAFFQVFLLA